MDLKEENRQLKEKIAQYETIFSSMSAPVIGSMLEKVMLVPLIGAVTIERLDLIETSILNHLDAHKKTECLIIDFTGVVLEDFQFIDFSTLVNRFEKFNRVVQYMGVRILHSGMCPTIAQLYINNGYTLSTQSFPTFRSALLYLSKQGYKLVQ